MLIRGLLLVVLFGFTPLHAQQLLHVPQGPRTWFIPEGGGEAVWVGQNGEPGAILDKAVLAAEEIVLAVESDARALVIWHGLSSFEVPLSSKGPHELRLAGNPARSMLAVNGQELPNLRGRWLALLLDDKQTQVRTTFKNATYANLKWSAVAKKDGYAAAAHPAEMNKAVSDAASRPAEVATSLDAARRSVLMVEVLSEKKDVVSRGSGFLIDDGSWLVTNHHVIKGGSALRAVAMVDQQQFPFEAELWALLADHDLALLKLKDVEPHVTAKRLVPLVLASSDPPGGTDVWALGYPMGVGFTITKGIVNGVRVVKDLPQDFRGSLVGMSPSSRWIQTDCTINPGNSGGPLINTTGQVVGVNTWSWRLGDNMFFALSAPQVSTFFSQRPAKPLGIAAVERSFASGIDVGGIPTVEVSNRVSPDGLRALVRTFKQGMICGLCRGDGSIKREVTTGYRTEGAFRVPNKEIRTERCSRCSGSGANSEDVLSRFLGHMAEGVAGLQKELPRSEEAIDYFRQEFTELARRYGYRFRNQASKELFVSRELVKKSEPVVMMGQIRSVAGSGDKFRVIEVGDPKVIVVQYATGVKWQIVISQPNRFVVIANPVMGGDVSEGMVIVGGIYAGSLQAGESVNLPVLQSGFIVPIID